MKLRITSILIVLLLLGLTLSVRADDSDLKNKHIGFIIPQGDDLETWETTLEELIKEVNSETEEVLETLK